MAMACFLCSFLLVIFFFDTNISASEIYTNVWAVKIRGNQREVQELARKYGFRYDSHLFQDYHTFKKRDLKKRSDRSSSEIDEKLKLEPKVEWFMQQKEKKYKLMNPIKTHELKDHLYIKRPEGSNQPTYNIIPVWEAGYTGEGILVAVVDDGVDGSHPDLSPNYNWYSSYDYVDGKHMAHGTSVSGHGNKCAGVIAGVAGNDKCGVGLAHKSQIAGIRIFDDDIRSTDATESKALVHKLDIIDIYSNSWGPGDMGWQVEGPEVLTSEALKQGIREGRGKLGAIYTFAAGNGGITGDSCAYNGYVNSIYTIAINGVNQDGSRPNYVEACPGIMATAYSSDSLTEKVKTVDNKKGCVDDFGATSAATAKASGLIALTLQANPSLTWRDVQHVIVYSARPAPGIRGVGEKHLQGGEWVKNKAGLYVSKFYGFGLMDASNMVSLAQNWSEVHQQLNCEIKGNDKNKQIPSTVSIEVKGKGCEIKFLEHVQIKVDLDFSRRGDLSLQLKAPSGTTSPLTRKRSIDNLTGYRNLTDWVITTLFHWGEDPTGKWELIIEDFDKRIPSSGTLHSWSLILYGTYSDPLKNATREDIIRGDIILNEKPTRTVATTKQPIPKNKPPIPTTKPVSTAFWLNPAFPYVITVLGLIVILGIVVCYCRIKRLKEVEQRRGEDHETGQKESYCKEQEQKEYNEKELECNRDVTEAGCRLKECSESQIAPKIAVQVQVAPKVGEGEVTCKKTIVKWHL